MKSKAVEKELTIVEHLSELRQRLFVCIVSIVLGASLSYIIVKKIIDWLILPVGNLVFIAPHEAFITYIKLSILAGFFLVSPIVLYQIWSFVAVGLTKNENKYILLFGPFSLVFFLGGASFAYFLILPLATRFLLGFATNNLEAMISLKNYVSFAGMLLLSFGVVFELPLIIMFLTKIGLVSAALLKKKRKYIILVIFIVAALLTPPDVVTQILMAGPLILLFEFSIILSKFISPARKTKTS